MLPLGYIGPRCPVHAAGPTALSHNLQVTVMSLWGILPSPLLFGGNVPALATDSTGPWTLALLANEEVLAVNQDSLATRGGPATRGERATREVALATAVAMSRTEPPAVSALVAEQAQGDRPS